jgi:hypothetical protein
MIIAFLLLVPGRQHRRKVARRNPFDTAGTATK